MKLGSLGNKMEDKEIKQEIKFKGLKGKSNTAWALNRECK